MSLAEHAVAAFERAWNTDDDVERLTLLAEACSSDALFVSPYGSFAGLDTCSDAIGEFRRQCPDAVVAFGIVEEHSGFLRVAWRTSFRNGQDDLVGEDFGQLGAEGRLIFVVSFNDAPATPETAG